MSDEPLSINAETAAAIRALIAEFDAGTASDLTLELIELLRPITGPSEPTDE